MKYTIRLALLALSITTWSAGAFAEVSQGQQHPLLITANQVREGQGLINRADQEVEKLKAEIRAKKEIISQRESLISKLDSDQKAENKLATRDQGAGEEARQARAVTARDRYQRRQAQVESLQADRQALAQLEHGLGQWQNHRKQITTERDQFKAQLRQQAEQYRYAAYCQAGMADQYKPASHFGSGLRNLGKTDAEKTEAEIQQILNDAHCVPSQAVSQRREPKERSIRKAIPVETASVAQPELIDASSAR